MQTGMLTNWNIGSNLTIIIAISAGLLILAAVFFGFWRIQTKGKATHPEDTKRLRTLAEAIAAVRWGNAKIADDYQTLATCLVDLFQAEIDYYYNARATSRKASAQFRSIAFVFGTIGILCPLIQPIIPDSYGWISSLGYVFLAAAAASLAGNELFGGTRGHVRYVITQYKLEELITQFLLDWSTFKQAFESSPIDQRPSMDKVIPLMKDFATASYAAIAEETHAWGSAILQATESYGHSVQKNQTVNR